MFWLWLLVGLVAVILLVSRFYLSGEDLGMYDAHSGEQFSGESGSSEERSKVEASLKVGVGPIRQQPRRQQLKLLREYIDNMAEGLDLPATITPVDAGGVPAEWVVAPESDPNRRLLYIHGGGFVMGSPRSHRNVTAHFAHLCGLTVLSIDYRLMPEHARLAGVEDCQTAYEWLLENGPDGASAPEHIYIAGDSAGGNLSLMMSAWSRDHGSRKADGVVALSPVTDLTLGSPSMKANIETDAMLGPMFGQLAKIPRPLLLWMGWFQNRTTPANPVLSPVFGDLSNLPPTLVHASESEMLRDDGRRYVNRAVSQGSVAKLQTWPNVVHVWHMFYPDLTEAREAWEEIRTFIADLG
ncbi:alpha/beta hydrolase [Halioglobus maricola]|uniref:Alpha/beta hydrolase n=1 Tax=Halioglobus maricola TaxID=2601894 RepID=A0A5P9NPG5_9GAMM|nr:alpha/beta hydrolase [Halioglobus maricola]QFU77682.1 alpha/beta hydrolase [Halioglobus maricola]